MFNNIDWFDDIFDIINIDDDHDDDKQEVERMIMEDYYEDLNFNSDQEEEDDDESMIIDKVDDDNTNKNDDQEQILSQKLSQLSTEGQKRPLSTPTSSQEENSKKKICLSTDADVQQQQQQQQSNQITSYIETMDEMFYRTMSNYDVMSANNLQVFIDGKHQIGMVELHLKRWIRYYEAGVQQQIWSREVKKLFTMKEINEKEYEIYVEKYVNELNGKLQQLQQQMKTYKDDCPQLTEIIEHKLDEFIQNYRLLPSQMKSEYHLARFEYEYQDQLLEREFLSRQPTKPQIEMATNLLKTHHDYMRTKNELIELKNRIQCNQPIQDNVTQALAKFSRATPVNDSNLYHQEMDYDDKQLQEHLSHLMMQAILETEKKLSQYEHLFQEQEQISNSILTSSLMTIINRRQQFVEEKLNFIQQFRFNYCLRKHFSQQSDHFNLPKISFSPTIIVHASMHALYKEHFRLLSRGPTYVPPYQMIQQDIKQYYNKQLQHDLNVLLVKCNVNLSQSMFLQKQIKDLYMEMFSTIIPTKSMYERAHYEQQLIETIRKDLKTFNLILRRTADQQNVFYLGDRKSFETLSNQFMLETDLFEIDIHINNENLQETRDYLTNKIKSMNQEFKTIFMDNTTKYKDQLNRITILIDKVELSYLYFLPDLSKQPILDVKPMIMTSKNNATYRLGTFLDQILRHMINIYRQGRMFSNGSDFLRKFHEYIDRTHRLSSTTKFVTITIDNFYHLVPHDLMLYTLTDFFIQCYHLPYIEKIHFTKIVELTRLFLYNNRFYYDDKIYRFIKGGPANSKLIETLANIYLSRMEQFLIDQHSMQHEFYGRYQNQIFFTWNQSSDELQQILQLMTSKYNHLNFDIQIQEKLTYLDIYLENRHGLLYSRIHRQQQSYILPYISNGNSLRKHSHWLRSSLIRAVRYCTTAEDFNQERIYLEMTYLANGYSLEFVEKHIQHFFTCFDGKAFQQLLPLDQRLYEKFRHRLFNFMSEQRQYMEKKQDSFKNNRRFHLSYIYDSMSPKGQFNKKLRQILSENIQLHNLKFESSKLQLDITTKHHYSLNTLLSRQRPSHPILNKH